MDAIFDSVCGPSRAACDSAGVWLGAILTLLVLSYLLRDTFLFRLAQSLLVGAAIGYGSAVVLRTVLWDQLLVPLATDFHTLWPLAVVPLLGGLLLLLKLVPAWSSSSLSNVPLGYLFGVGAALAIGGAVNSTLTQQVASTIGQWPPPDALSAFNAVLILVGTLGALLAFRFTRQDNTPLLHFYSRAADAWGRLGRGFIMVAFGAILANVLAARVSVLVGQLYFLGHDWLQIVK
ncbi:MAG: hypothetical protein ACM3JD_00225 [Rudaea sp.]